MKTQLNGVLSRVLSRALERCGSQTPRMKRISAFSSSLVSMLEGNSMEIWMHVPCSCALGRPGPTHAWEDQGSRVEDWVWEVTHSWDQTKISAQGEDPQKEDPRSKRLWAVLESGGGFGRWDKASWRGAGGRPHPREAQLASREWGKSVDAAGSREEEGYACPHHQSKGPACCEGSGEKTEQ